MSEKSPLDWALLAVAAATIKPSEVTVVENSVERDLPAISIGDTVLCQVRYRVWGRDTGTFSWQIGVYEHDSLKDALVDAVSKEVYRRVEEALGQAGLAT